MYGSYMYNFRQTNFKDFFKDKLQFSRTKIYLINSHSSLITLLAKTCHGVSSLLNTWDFSPVEMSASQRQKFHTDDVKSVWNLVRSSDWLM